MAKVRDSAAMHRTVLYSCLRAKNWYSFPFDWPIVTIPKKMRTLAWRHKYHTTSALGIPYQINSGSQRIGSRWA